MLGARLLSAVAVAFLGACAPAGGPPAASPEVVDSPADHRPTGARDGRAAASQVAPERPGEVELPSGALLQVDVSVTDAAGRLFLPDDVGRAGWWREGARLGDRFGALVLAAHVDSFAEGVGPIAEMLDTSPGDTIVLRSHTLRQEYAVTSADLVPRTDLGLLAELLAFTGPHRLVLITCGGPYEPGRGYRDNLVVVATPRGSLRRS